MSRYRNSLLALGLLVSFHAFASTGKEFTKSLVKEFDITRDGIVGVANKYGDVDVRTWSSSKVKMEVTIRVEAKNEDTAKEVFNRISVLFDNSSAAVRARTEIESASSWKSWFNWGSGDEFEINYVVHVPQSVALEIDNKYGDIYVADKPGRANVTLKYGDLRLGMLTGDVALTMAYADGTVGSTGRLQLDLAYADLNIGKADDVEFTGKYSDITLGTIGNLRSTTAYVDVRATKVGDVSNMGKYDDFAFEEVRSLDVSSKYSGFNIEVLRDHGKFEMSYGSLSIENLRQGFSYIDINTTYTDVEITVDPSAQFTLNATTKYCDIRHYDLEITHEIEKSSEHVVKGYRGSSGAPSKITATMSYGELSVE